MDYFDAWIVLALGGGIVVLGFAVYLVQRHDKGPRPGLVAAAIMITGLVFAGRGVYLLQQARRDRVPPETPEAPRAAPRSS